MHFDVHWADISCVQDAKVKDSDNDDSTSAAVNIEDEASSHGL